MTKLNNVMSQKKKQEDSKIGQKLQFCKQTWQANKQSWQNLRFPSFS